MTTVKQVQETIRTLAGRVDSSRDWDSLIKITGVVDKATISGAQIVLYGAKQKAPVPGGLQPLIVPGTQADWKAALEANLTVFNDYARATLGEPKPGLQTVLFLGTMITGCIGFCYALKKGADYQDRTDPRRER